MMEQQMEFPETFEKFAKEYGFKDDKEVYTNGIDLIPIYRVKQWLEHDNRLRTIETDTAYECGKHVNKWIPVSKRLPEDGQSVIFCDIDNDIMVGYHVKGRPNTHFTQDGTYEDTKNVRAWMPLPEPYDPQESEINGKDDE